MSAMFTKVWAIALNTFREGIRNKALYSVMFFSCVTVLVATIFGSVSVGSLPKIVKDFGLFSLSFFGAILSMVAGVSLLNKELNRKTIYNILSKPISRWQFVVGKYIGLTMTVSLQVLLMGCFLLFFAWTIEGVLDPLLFQGMLFALLEIVMVCAIATFFSTIVVTTTLTALYTCSFYIAGRSVACLDFFIPRQDDVAYSSAYLSKAMASFLYYMLPDFNAFNISDRIVYGEAIGLGQIFAAFVYSTSYSVALLCLAAVVFERREFD